LKRESRPVDGNPGESVLQVVDNNGNFFYVKEPQRESRGFYNNLFNVNNSGIDYIKNGGKLNREKINERNRLRNLKK